MSSALLNNRYEVLDLLSESLYSTVISLPHGGLIERVSGILQWRNALLDGELPDHEQLNWPDQQIKITLLKRLESLNIARYCRQQEELTDLILIVGFGLGTVVGTQIKRLGYTTEKKQNGKV